MSDKTIRACPFCGGSACLYAYYSGRHRTNFIYVKCQLCGAQAKAFTDPEDPERNKWKSAACDNAVMAWNTRTGEKADE